MDVEDICNVVCIEYKLGFHRHLEVFARCLCMFGDPPSGTADRSSEDAPRFSSKRKASCNELETGRLAYYLENAIRWTISSRPLDPAS